MQICTENPSGFLTQPHDPQSTQGNGQTDHDAHIRQKSSPRSETMKAKAHRRILKTIHSVLLIEHQTLVFCSESDSIVLVIMCAETYMQMRPTEVWEKWHVIPDIRAYLAVCWGWGRSGGLELGHGQREAYVSVCVVFYSENLFFNEKEYSLVVKSTRVLEAAWIPALKLTSPRLCGPAPQPQDKDVQLSQSCSLIRTSRELALMGRKRCWVKFERQLCPLT